MTAFSRKRVSSWDNSKHQEAKTVLAKRSILAQEQIFINQINLGQKLEDC